MNETNEMKRLVTISVEEYDELRSTVRALTHARDDNAGMIRALRESNFALLARNSRLHASFDEVQRGLTYLTDLLAELITLTAVGQGVAEGTTIAANPLITTKEEHNNG